MLNQLKENLSVSQYLVLDLHKYIIFYLIKNLKIKKKLLLLASNL